MKEYSRGLIILFITTILWGSTFPLTKELLRYGTTVEILFLRFFFTSLLLILIRPYYFYSFLRNFWKTDVLLLFLGVINFTAIYLQTIGLETVSSANAGFITALSVLMVPVLNHFRGKYHLERKIILSVIIALLGIYLLSYGFSIPQEMYMGDVWILASAFCYSVYIITVEEVSKKNSAVDILTVVFFITAVIFLIANIPILWTNYGKNREFLMQYEFILYMSLLVVPGSIFSYGMMFYGQRFVPSNLAAMIYLMEPVFATAIAGIFFREPVFTHTILGGMVILLALAVSIGFRKNEAG